MVDQRDNFHFLLMGEDMYSGAATVFVPYANAGENANLEQFNLISLSFDQSPQRVNFVMDTGSVGIIASPDNFQPASDAENLGPGVQYYSSSGITQEGTWWSSTQNIYDGNGNLLVVAKVPVLQVTKVRHGTAGGLINVGQVDNNPTGVAMMGVGFARESIQQPRGMPAYNPFLNLQMILGDGQLQTLPNDWCNGYVVTSEGVHLGLTSSNTSNVGWVKLLPWPEYSTSALPEWHAAPMTVSVDGVKGNGTILMDTGVANGFLTPPVGAVLANLNVCPAFGKCLPDNTKVDVYLPNDQNPVAFYSFTVGTANPMQPVKVADIPALDVFLNTSRFVFAGMDYIYDNTNGYVGYIWKNTGATIGYVHPPTCKSTITLTSSETSGQEVAFIAKVMGNHPTIAPTGSVTFAINGEISNLVPLDSNGQAIFSPAVSLEGGYTIQAMYSGDSIYNRAASFVISQANEC